MGVVRIGRWSSPVIVGVYSSVIGFRGSFKVDHRRVGEILCCSYFVCMVSYAHQSVSCCLWILVFLTLTFARWSFYMLCAHSEVVLKPPR